MFLTQLNQHFSIILTITAKYNELKSAINVPKSTTKKPKASYAEAKPRPASKNVILDKGIQP